MIWISSLSSFVLHCKKIPLPSFYKNKRCGMIAFEITIQQNPNEVVLSNYRLLYSDLQLVSYTYTLFTTCCNNND